MASIKKPSHVLLFEDDVQRMKDWVLQYPDIETGGQFFGLFTHEKCPYVHTVIGPGKNCRHESHSFHQDIPYLHEVGKYLNEEFMMCHIGEWHSHHKLRLRQPSHGDLNSVWKNFPEGVQYFILVIATIEEDDVKLWPWLFSGTTRTHESILVKTIPKENVFIKDEDIVRKIASGAEVPPNKAKLWFHTDVGTGLVQYLNSKLEKIIDKSSKVEIRAIKEETLSLSFQRNGCGYVIEFRKKFESACIICKPRGGQSIQLSEIMIQGTKPEQFVDRIINHVCNFNVTSN